jgi:hypothetical protein
MSHSHSGECVNCGAGEPAGPVEAISFEADTPQWKNFPRVNAEFLRLSAPGRRGQSRQDHPVVATLPPQR